MSVIQRIITKFAWSHLFLLWAVQGLLALAQLASLPSDSENGILFGFSTSRLGGLVFLLFWVFLTAALAILSARNTDWRIKRLDPLFASRAGDTVLVVSVITAIAAQAILAILWGLSQRGLLFSYAAYATRLAPILNLFTLSAVELFAWMTLKRRQISSPTYESDGKLIKRAAIVWSILGALTLLVITTGLGIVPDNSGEWGLPGVALLEWQVLAAIILGIITITVETKFNVNKIKRVDIWISIFIWLGTVFLWLSQPVNPSVSATAPRPPNYEIYPYIDAQVYDEYAQSILIGNGMRGTEIAPRPLYIVFLAFLHTLVGQDYNMVIAAQSLILAFLPVALYWVGREFYGRPLGIGLAALTAWRDVTANWVASSAENLSYSKLYLSEIPVSISLILFVLLGIRWARNNYPNFTAFLAGGILGIGVLIRTQAITALPVILFIIWLADRKNFGALLRGALFMILGITLVASPWVWRNWINTGEFIFDNPATQTINLAQRYSRMNGVEADALRHGGETSAEYNNRLMGIFFESVSANPSKAVYVAANRFFNNCVTNILIMPLRNDLKDIKEIWHPDRAFWEEWRAAPTSAQSALLIFYLFLLGLGLAAAWNRLGLIGLAPMGVNLVYNLWTSIALLSGQRFLLAMDWSIYLYYLIGLLVLINGFLYILIGGRPMIVDWHGLLNAIQPESIGYKLNIRSYILAGALFFAIGASIPTSEKLFPKRYPPVTADQLWVEFISSPAFERSKLDAACLREYINTNQLYAVNGRDLSPRFYDVGEGEATDKFGYKISDEARLVFLIVGNLNSLLELKTAQPPEFFPNAADIIVYLDNDEPLNAQIILIQTAERGEIYFSEKMETSLNCFAK